MKKVLSVLLAVCLFATLLVPAFAEGLIPTYGKPGDVVKVEFDKAEYNLSDIVHLRNGNDGLYVDVVKLLTCRDSNGNRTNFNEAGLTETDIRAYNTNNQNVLSLNQNTGKIDSIKPHLATKTTVKLTITTASGKQASTNIVVDANMPDTKEAYGYTVKNVDVNPNYVIDWGNNNYVPGEATEFTVKCGSNDKAATLLGLVPVITNNTSGGNFVGAISDTDNTIIVYTADDASSHIVDFAAVQAELRKVGATDLGITGAQTTITTAGVATTENATASFEVNCLDANVALALVQKVGTLAGGKLSVNNGTGSMGFSAAQVNTIVRFTGTANTAFDFNKNAADSAVIAINDLTISGLRSLAYADILNAASGSAAALGTAAVVDIAWGAGDSNDVDAFLAALTDVDSGTAGTQVMINGFKYTAAKATNDLKLTALTPFAAVPQTDAAKIPFIEFVNSIKFKNPVDNTVVVSVSKFGTPSTGSQTPTDLSKAYKYNIGDEIKPVLSSYAFTGAQKAGFTFMLRTDYSSEAENIFTLKDDGDGITSRYGLDFYLEKDADGVPTLYIGQNEAAADLVGTYVYVRVRNNAFASAQAEKEFSIKIVGAPGKTDKVLPAEKTLGVGQVLDLRTLSKSVKDTKSYWVVAPYGKYQDAESAGMTAKIIMETFDEPGNAYGWSVKGLAPGVVTIELWEDGAIEDTMKLNIGTGYPTEGNPAISAASAAVKVNDQVKLSVKNLNSDQYAKWSIDNNNVSLGNFDGPTATIYGKKVGTTVVTVKVYESNEKDAPLVKEFKVNVTVKAAESKPVATPDSTTTAPTTNPQTGDSLFANLF